MGGACSAYGGEKRRIQKFIIIIIFIYCNWVVTRWWGDLRGRDHLGDRGVDLRIILRWIFRKWDVGVWTGSCWLSIGTGGGHL